MSVKPVRALLLFSMLASASLLLTLSEKAVCEQNWTYVYVNEPPYGNWTYIRKPVVPMRINASQVQIGANWTYVFTLIANRTYHVYCYGDWIDKGSAPKTDYDIYVYSPSGELEGHHTEAAGFPEHLGTTVEQPFFAPRQSGNYTFVVRNDPRESQGADAATFMVIEHVETNTWHSVFIEGKQGNASTQNTSWAYEFATSSERVEICVQVPNTLDMYEARLYLMANPSSGKGQVLSNMSLAWEPGLYGEVNGIFGGYNLDSRGIRGEAYASCEDYGQDMFINYTSPCKGECLYHLVLIGEAGVGNVSFRVKTNFGESTLQLDAPLQRIFPNNETTLTARSNNSQIQRAQLHYSTDEWNTMTTAEMEVSNHTCKGTIPGQEAGVTVNYHVEAYDFLDNAMNINGSYTVKHKSDINFTLDRATANLGENISIVGFVTPILNASQARVKLTFTALNGSKIEQHQLLRNSSFSSSFKPSGLGSWSVKAEFLGDGERHEAMSEVVDFVVVEPSFLSKYSGYLYAGVGIAGVALIAVLIIRRRQ